MADERCPNCGTLIPEAAGQHASALSAGVVECPNCGAKVSIDRPGAGDSEDEARGSGDVRRAPETAGGEEGAPESFSGEESLEGVMDELQDKPGGPGSGS
jgi:ribosomal protein S27AE